LAYFAPIVGISAFLLFQNIITLLYEIFWYAELTASDLKMCPNPWKWSLHHFLLTYWKVLLFKSILSFQKGRQAWPSLVHSLEILTWLYNCLIRNTPRTRRVFEIWVLISLIYLRPTLSRTFHSLTVNSFDEAEDPFHQKINKLLSNNPVTHRFPWRDICSHNPTRPAYNSPRSSIPSVTMAFLTLYSQQSDTVPEHRKPW